LKLLLGKHPMSEETVITEKTITSEETIYYDQRSVALRTTQAVYFVAEHDKKTMLGLILEDYKKTQIVMLVKSKKKADALSDFLNSKAFSALAIHGNHREEQQEECSSKFNEGSLHIIITTDMTLKKLALKNIKLVLSHDLPENPQDYYNRLALMKEEGVAMALISPADEGYLSDLEFNMKAEIEEKTLEGFVTTSAPKTKQKKDRTKKPRHSKKKKA